MQISSEQVNKIQEGLRRGGSETAKEAKRVKGVTALAAAHGVKMDEVRRFTERAMMAEEDPARERRVQELARRVASGSYRLESEDLLDMAERRAIADRSSGI